MTYRAPGVFLAACLLLSACSTAGVRSSGSLKEIRVTPHQLAWEAARFRLHAMCPSVPKSEAELTEALKTRHANDCYIRFAKDTYLPSADDWHWHWLPPYRVVAAVHDEELRKRMVPKVYEEYMLGLNRYLSERADRGEITPAQFRYAFNAGWQWVNTKMQGERLLTEDNAQALRTRPAAGDTLGAIAGELATVATVALSLSATDRRYEPAPATCHADAAKDRSYTIWCY